MPDVFEGLRRAVASSELIKDTVQQEIFRQMGELSNRDAELLHFNRENPEKYLIPDRLRPYADALKAMYDANEYQLVGRGMVGRWPNSAIQRNAQLMNQIGVILGETKNPLKALRLKGQLGQLERYNEILSGLKYARRLVDMPQVATTMERLWEGGKMTSKLSDEMKRFLGREALTMDDLREAINLGANFTLETDARIALADTMAEGRYRLNLHDFHDWAIKNNPELIKPEASAPADWQKVPGLRQYEGYRLNPMYADALSDFLDVPNRPGLLLGAYDSINGMYKQVRFYNFMVMGINNLFQGYAAGGVRALTYIPRGLKHAKNKDSMYRAAQKMDVFSRPSDVPQEEYLNQMRLSLDLLAKNEPALLTKIKKAADVKSLPEFFGRFLLPTDQNTMLRMNRKFTWWLDRAFRTATFEALMDKGYSMDEAATRASDFNADYSYLRTSTNNVLRRILLTPSYKSAMWLNLFPKMLKHPKKYAASDLRVLGMFGASQIMAAMTGYAFLEGYRYVKKVTDKETGEEREDVVQMAGPFSEPFKLYGRLVQGWESGTTPTKKIQKAVERSLYNWLAPMPHMIASLLRNRNWKGDEIVTPGAPEGVQLKQFARGVLEELYPILWDAEQWSNEKEPTINKVLRLATILKYRRRPMQEWYEVKLKRKMRDQRRYLRQVAEETPEILDEMTRKVAKGFQDYVDQLDADLAKAEGKLEGMSSKSAVERVAAQFGVR
ncbi:MAG: hypothetical protein ABIJ57_10625 [Pseudomonadota bacterium]